MQTKQKTVRDAYVGHWNSLNACKNYSIHSHKWEFLVHSTNTAVLNILLTGLIYLGRHFLFVSAKTFCYELVQKACISVL